MLWKIAECHSYVQRARRSDAPIYLWRLLKIKGFFCEWSVGFPTHTSPADFIAWGKGEIRCRTIIWAQEPPERDQSLKQGDFKAHQDRACAHSERGLQPTYRHHFLLATQRRKGKPENASEREALLKFRVKHPTLQLPCSHGQDDRRCSVRRNAGASGACAAVSTGQQSDALRLYVPAAGRRDWVPAQPLFEAGPLPATLTVTYFPLLFNKLLGTKAVTHSIW